MLTEYARAAPAYDRAMPGNPSARSDGGLDLKEILKILRRRMNSIIVAVLSITTIVAVITLSLPPRYVTVASVMIEQQQRVIDQRATGESVVQEPTDSSTLAAEINLLRSRTYAQKVVEELGLLSDPNFNSNLHGDTGPLTILAGRLSAVWDWIPRSWSNRVARLVGLGRTEQTAPTASAYGAEGHAAADRSERRPAKGAEAPEQLSLPAPDTPAYESLMRSAVGALLAGLSIKPGGNNQILIEFQSSDPRQAAKIADKVAELYVTDQLAIKQEAVDRAIDWLKERVTALRERVLRSEGAVVAFREQNGLTAAAGKPAGGPAQDLATIQAEVAQKEELLRWVQELRKRGAAPDTIAAVLSIPSLVDLRQREAELDRQETMLRVKYGAQHPEIIQLNSGTHPINLERKYLEERVNAAIEAALRKLEGELAFARRQEKEAEARLAESPTEPTEDGQAEVKLNDLQRQAEADRSLYVTLLNRLKEVSEQRNLLDSGAKVASRAGVPGEPDFPKPGLMTFGGFLGALTLGILLAFLVDYLDGGLRTGQQIERLLGLPNLGFIPRVTRLKRGEPLRLHRYLIAKPQSAYAEAIRAVQIASMDAVDARQRAPVVLVTSSLPGEGKTTLALSLGASAACSGYKAVVVDLDMRRPRLHCETNLTPAIGLVELLDEEIELDDVLQPSGDHVGLDVLPVKRLPTGPADLVRSPKITSLIAELRSRYDYVVLDSPPLLGVVDAKLAARLADAVLFVIRWEKTKEAAAHAGLENLVDHHTPAIGAVLTQVDVRRHARLGYGESVQYRARYDAYYRS
jgi:succinoglycan biosynthesis transport protein ExoP